MLRPFLAQAPVVLRPFLAQAPVALRPFLAQAPVVLRPFLAQAPVALRANNVRPYVLDCTDRIETVRRGRTQGTFSCPSGHSPWRTLRFTFHNKIEPYEEGETLT